MTVDSEHQVFISVVIPVYRSERILPVLCRRLAGALAALQRTYEIILIDDRSPDGSWGVMQQLVDEFPAVVALRLSRNFGQHYAITAGLDIARGEWTVVMDCDLQDSPEDIPRLLAKALEGYDVVLARRQLRKDSFFKQATSTLFYRAFRTLSGYAVDPTVGSYRIMRHTVVDAYRSMREASRLFGGMIHWLGFETGYLDVDHAPRYEGRSSYNFRTLVRLALHGITAFSNRPLYFSIAVGLMMAVLSAGYATFLIVRYLLHPQIGVAGWLSTITAFTFIGGLILLNLGILGIYVGRIYDQTKGRPLYVVDRIVTNAGDLSHKTYAQQS